ncbi:DNA cytosine methyltransferase [Rouxiella badensis]|nr:DNA cytosine methyltransferase [Rouxiella badensis]
MNMAAYYNEFDPYAAQWLRNLIKAGHIAPGFVDERSIVDVKPEDLTEFTQCHFFAGIGAWSLALRNAGWPDDKPVWTGSCPCQPFSAAGNQLGRADERHLAPVWLNLIKERQPATLFGEQVAAAIGKHWLDDLFTELEEQGYACGAAVLPACGVGAPHIRQRLWFGANRVANTNSVATRGIANSAYSAQVKYGAENRDDNRFRHDGVIQPHGVANSYSSIVNGDRNIRARGRDESPNSNISGGLAKSGSERWEWRERAEKGCKHDRVVNTNDQRLQRVGANNDTLRREGQDVRPVGLCDRTRFAKIAAPTNGYWRDADWLLCRDGKWRPVEPGTFPLAHGITSRVGRLRAYGNAISPEAAKEFILAFNGAVNV